MTETERDGKRVREMGRGRETVRKMERWGERRIEEER